MKKILYLYGSLLIAVAQAFIWTSIFALIFKYGIESGSDVLALIIFAIPLILLVLIDAKVRDYLWWYEYVLAY